MALDNRQLLVLEFVTCLIAWAAIARVFLAPRFAALDSRRALRLAIAPQMFRIIGVTLLAHNVPAPGLDREFARWVAIGDFATSMLAIAAFIALGYRGRIGVWLATITTVVGAADLVHNLAMGVRVNAAEYLAAGWFVVALVVPLMLVAHVVAGHLLWTTTFARRKAQRGSAVA